MNDKDFQILQLKAVIAPSQARWPAPEIWHWQKIHAAADEARDSVAKAWAEFDAIDADHDLSPAGRDRKKRKQALEAIAALEGSKTLASAKEAVERQLKTWAEKTGLAVKPAANIAEATIHAQIRDRVAAMKTGRMGFLEKHATDAVVSSALLTAPAFLSGLSDAELAMVNLRVEQHLAPEIVEAREMTVKALEEVEGAWPKGIDKIAERAGLTKGSDGTWRDPSMSVAA